MNANAEKMAAAWKGDRRTADANEQARATARSLSGSAVSTDTVAFAIRRCVNGTEQRTHSVIRFVADQIAADMQDADPTFDREQFMQDALQGQGL